MAVSKVTEIRALTGSSQAKFADMLHVGVGILRNREQGRREPTAPAGTLLRGIKNGPRAAVKTLGDENLPAQDCAPRSRLVNSVPVINRRPIGEAAFGQERTLGVARVVHEYGHSKQGDHRRQVYDS